MGFGRFLLKFGISLGLEWRWGLSDCYSNFESESKFGEGVEML